MTHTDLAALRERLGMTRREMAEELGISASRLLDYEIGYTRGRRTPAPIPKAIQLALVEIERNHVAEL
jgi:transcriptional regulator with XRE-family HTH domain